MAFKVTSCSGRQQRGRAVLAVLAVLVLVMAALIWKRESDKGALKAAEARAAAEALAAEQARAQQEAARADAERRALERSQAAARKAEGDALASAYRTFADILARWHDALRVAGATARIQLAGPMATLQAIRREAEGLQPPQCLVAAKGHLTRSMNASIDGMMIFMVDTKDYQMVERVRLMQLAADQMKEVEAARASCPAISN